MFEFKNDDKKYFKLLRQNKEEMEMNDERVRRSDYSCKIIFPENYAIIDDLNIADGSGIYIFKINRPVEPWMFNKGVALQFEECATLIAELNIGYIGTVDSIDKIWVEDKYRRRGIAGFMIQRTIEWARERGTLNLRLIAGGGEVTYDNALPEKELIQFYEKFGFQKINPEEKTSVLMELNL